MNRFQQVVLYGWSDEAMSVLDLWLSGHSSFASLRTIAEFSICASHIPNPYSTRGQCYVCAWSMASLALILCLTVHNRFSVLFCFGSSSFSLPCSVKPLFVCGFQWPIALSMVSSFSVAVWSSLFYFSFVAVVVNVGYFLFLIPVSNFLFPPS